MTVGMKGRVKWYLTSTSDVYAEAVVKGLEPSCGATKLSVRLRRLTPCCSKHFFYQIPPISVAKALRRTDTSSLRQHKTISSMVIYKGSVSTVRGSDRDLRLISPS